MYIFKITSVYINNNNTNVLSNNNVIKWDMFC